MPTSSEPGRIRAEDLGKRFLVLRDQARLLGLARHAWRGKEHLWALRHLSFELEPGQSLGVIGANGSGKSTLLQLLAGVTEPSEGTLDVGGRVASLITIGAGFRHELTGRENVHLGGVVLGMSRAEVTRKFDEIVEFSGLGSAIDRPVKHYSSGMFMRLGFAVAAFADPEVLLVDEVLAVGDDAFRARCYERVDALLRAGVTLVFVSHAMPVVHRLCARTVLLARGESVFDGPTDQAIARYHALLDVPDVEEGELEFEAQPGAQRVAGGASVEFEVMDPLGEPASAFPVGGEAVVRGRIRFEREVDEPFVTLAVASGAQTVYVLPFGHAQGRFGPGDELEAEARLTMHLGVGTYQFVIAARGRREEHLLFRKRSQPVFVSSTDDVRGWGLADLAGRPRLARPVRLAARRVRG